MLLTVQLSCSIGQLFRNSCLCSCFGECINLPLFSVFLSYVYNLRVDNFHFLYQDSWCLLVSAHDKIHIEPSALFFFPSSPSLLSHAPCRKLHTHIILHASAHLVTFLSIAIITSRFCFWQCVWQADLFLFFIVFCSSLYWKTNMWLALLRFFWGLHTFSLGKNTV